MAKSKVYSSPLSQAILKLANTAEGFGTNSVIPGFNPSAPDLKGALRSLLTAGAIHPVRVKLRGKFRAVYFADLRTAEAFRERHVPTAAPTVVIAPRARQRAPWPSDAVAIITPKTIFTRGPSPQHALRSNTHEGMLG